MIRAYDPASGRFLSRDPIGESGDAVGNLYAYVGGNPVSIIDPLGLQEVFLPEIMEGLMTYLRAIHPGHSCLLIRTALKIQACANLACVKILMFPIRIQMPKFHLIRILMVNRQTPSSRLAQHLRRNREHLTQQVKVAGIKVRAKSIRLGQKADLGVVVSAGAELHAIPCPPSVCPAGWLCI